MTERGRKMGERILKIVRFYQNKNFHVTFSTPDVKILDALSADLNKF